MPIPHVGMTELQRMCDDGSAAPVLLLLTCLGRARLPPCDAAASQEALDALEQAATHGVGGGSSPRFARAEGVAFPLAALRLAAGDLPAMVLLNACGSLGATLEQHQAGKIAAGPRP